MFLDTLKGHLPHTYTVVEILVSNLHKALVEMFIYMYTCWYKQYFES